MNFFLFFMWLFPITISIIPIGTGKIAAIFFVIYIFLHWKDVDLKLYLLVSMYILILLIYYTLMTIVSAKYDYSLSYLLLLNIIEFSLGALYFSNLFISGKLTSNLFSTYLSLSGLVLSFSIFFCLIFPAFRDYLAELLPQFGNIDPLRLSRIRGLSNGGGADHSIQLAISSIGFLYFIVTQDQLYKKIISAIGFSLILCATFFVARTGLVIEFLLILYTIFIIRNKSKFVLIAIVIFVIFLFLHSYLFDLLDAATNGIFSEKTLPWIISLFSIFTDGKVNSSNEELLQMLYIPSNWSILIFGTGIFSNFGHYQYSDSGFVKYIYSFGFFITFTILCLYLFLLKKAYMYKNILINMLSVFLFIMLLFNIKEPFMLKIGSAHIFYFILFVCLSFKVTK